MIFRKISRRLAGALKVGTLKLAEVEPATRHLNGEDLSAFVVSANINRRHLTKSQRAMAVAMIYPTPALGGKRQKGKHSAAALEIKAAGVNESSLSQARTVLATTPDAAAGVLAGQRAARR